MIGKAKLVVDVCGRGRRKEGRRYSIQVGWWNDDDDYCISPKSDREKEGDVRCPEALLALLLGRHSTQYHNTIDV